MSDEFDLDVVAARANAATEGPWWCGGDGIVWDRFSVAIAEGCSHHGLAQQRDNCEFIAHARTDVPLLVAALRAAEQRLAEATLLTEVAIQERDAEIERLNAAEQLGILIDGIEFIPLHVMRQHMPFAVPPGQEVVAVFRRPADVRA